ncbi:Concanavalin A-like lectin/glucanases superfamily, partial [Thermoplasmatales archaeon SCGC AB-539-N05]
TGNSWTDLSGYGTVATRTGGLPFTTVNNVGCFDFDGSNYFHAPETNVPMEDAFTLSMWYYHEGIGERDTVFEKDGDTYNSYEQELACTLETNDEMSYFWGRTTYDYHRIGSLTQDSWQQIFITRAHGDAGQKTTTGFINNEAASFSQNLYRSTDAITPTTGNVAIGSGYAGAVESGYLSAVKVYDKVLSESERDQNYNALGYRFGKTTNSTTTDTVPLNTYSHIVAKKEGTNCSIYINGQLSKSFNCNISQDLTGNLQIGHRASGVNEYFNGTIDEVQIWNRALSQEEINASYNSKVNQLYHNFTGLSDENYTYYAHAIDTAGNENTTETRNINVSAADTIKPTSNISTISPYNVTSSPLNITATASDTGGGSVANVTLWYRYSSDNSSWAANWWNSDWNYRKLLTI